MDIQHKKDQDVKVYKGNTKKFLNIQTNVLSMQA